MSNPTQAAKPNEIPRNDPIIGVPFIVCQGFRKNSVKDKPEDYLAMIDWQDGHLREKAQIVSKPGDNAHFYAFGVKVYLGFQTREMKYPISVQVTYLKNPKQVRNYPVCRGKIWFAADPALNAIHDGWAGATKWLGEQMAAARRRIEQIQRDAAAALPNLHL